METFSSFIRGLGKQLLYEKYQNLFLSSQSQRELYAHEVWLMLQNAYSAIGGIKGSGFNSKEDMISKIPFWKLYFKDGKLKVVYMYKDKSGRKLVAMATDGSPEAKETLISDLKRNLKVSYMEVSGPLLGMILKHIPIADIRALSITHAER